MKKAVTYLALVATLLISNVKAGDKKCRGLAMSGGSNRATWEAGVIWGLLHHGDPADFAWDVVSGISAGAINTGQMSVWKVGDELAMSEAMSDAYASINTEETLFTTWKGDAPTIEKVALTLPDYIAGKYVSLLDDSNAISFLKEQFKNSTGYGRRWTTGSIDANTGRFITMNQTNCEFEDLPTCTLASGSIPAALPPQHWNGHILADGGTLWDINIDSAINQCLDIVDDPADIIIDIIICWDHTPNKQEVSKDAFTNWKSARNIRDYWFGPASIEQEKRSHINVNYQYYFGLHHIHERCPTP